MSGEPRTCVREGEGEERGMRVAVGERKENEVGGTETERQLCLGNTR